MGIPIAPLLAALLLLTSTTQCKSLSNSIHSRSIHQARRLRATPYGPTPTPSAPSAAPQSETPFPTFANKGGPPDLTGAWTDPQYVGIVLPSGFASTIYLGNGEYEQQIGRYLTWECTGVEGEYIATTLRRDIYSNGTTTVKYRCEMGKVSLGPDSQYGWNSSDVACPNPKTVEYNYPLYRMESTTLQTPNTLICTAGANAQTVKGMDTSEGPGLDPTVPLGSTSGAIIPPPLKPSTFPPVYRRAGGPPDTVGIWWADANTTAELGDGNSFSSVVLQPDNTFQTVLGRFNSYECADGPGEYRASLSFTYSLQDGSDGTGVGCTTGRVNLAQETYLWIGADAEACPEVVSEAGSTGKRSGTSEVLPAATSQTCK